MVSRLLGAVLLLFAAVVNTAPADASIYLYEISAYYGNQPPGSGNSVIGSFTLDDTLGPASISNVDIHATLPLIEGASNFTFDQVVGPELTWPLGYLRFANHTFSNGDTYFQMYINYDTSANDGSYLIGMGGNALNPHQSEISVIGVNDWQGIEGRMTLDAAPAVPEPSTWAMLLIGLVGIGFMAYRKSNTALMGAR